MFTFVYNFYTIKVLFEPGLEFRAKRASNVTSHRYEPPSPPITLVWFMEKNGLRTPQCQWFTETIRYYNNTIPNLALISWPFFSSLNGSGAVSCVIFLIFMMLTLRLAPCFPSQSWYLAVPTDVVLKDHIFILLVGTFGRVWGVKGSILFILYLQMWKPPGGLLISNVVLFDIHPSHS